MFLGPAKALSIVAENWRIVLTMVFGSLIAGGTSEGGGAIAFPVFTKVLNVRPYDAKVFSLMIQSVGMTAASLSIIAMKIRVEWRVILWASFGGLFGLVISSVWFAHAVPPALTRVVFTVMMSSFAFTLFILNRETTIRYLQVPIFSHVERCFFFAAGFFGGVLSGLVGSGIDILVFSMMVLLFKMSEKIATPTSVILMAINAVVGALLHALILGGMTEQVHDYWLAAIPVVVVGAPLGAMLCARLSREAIVRILLCLITIELITSLLILPMSRALLVSGLIALIIFTAFFYWMYRTGMYDQSNFDKVRSSPPMGEKA